MCDDDCGWCYDDYEELESRLKDAYELGNKAVIDRCHYDCHYRCSEYFPEEKNNRQFFMLGYDDGFITEFTMKILKICRSEKNYNEAQQNSYDRGLSIGYIDGLTAIPKWVAELSTVDMALCKKFIKEFYFYDDDEDDDDLGFGLGGGPIEKIPYRTYRLDVNVYKYIRKQLMH